MYFGFVLFCPMIGLDEVIMVWCNSTHTMLHQSQIGNHDFIETSEPQQVEKNAKEITDDVASHSGSRRKFVGKKSSVQTTKSVDQNTKGAVTSTFAFLWISWYKLEF